MEEYQLIKASIFDHILKETWSISRYDFTRHAIMHALHSHDSAEYHRLGALQFILKMIKDEEIDINCDFEFDPEISNITQEWALHYEPPFIAAASKGYTETVKAFIKLGADIDLEWHEESAIEVAIKNGHFNVVELLIKDVDIDPNYLLEYAIENGSDRIDIVELIIRHGPADVKKDYVEFALSCNHVKIAKLLRLNLLKRRLRTWSRVIGRFMRMYGKVVEIRYAPGGAGYNASLENYENARVKRVRLE